MLDLIMKLLGYENINKIKIPEDYKKPKEIKLRAKKNFYKKYGILPEIILDRKNVLLDGFCSYYIAQVWSMTYVKVRRVKGLAIGIDFGKEESKQVENHIPYIY